MDIESKNKAQLSSLTGESVKIVNHEITVKEFRGQRVVTFKDIDTVHERPDGTARKRFNDNKNRFSHGKDFFFVKPSDVETSEIRTSEINNAGTYLITERGYLMLVKSFTDDLAWEVQGQLVDSYFAKPVKPLSTSQQIQLLARGNIELEQKIDAVDQDLQDFKHDLPLLGCDMDRITTAVKKMGVECLGGKDTPAYQDKSLRGKVYSDIYDQLKRQFGVSTYKSIKRSQCDTAVSIVHNYQLPMVLLDEITDANAQMRL